MNTGENWILEMIEVTVVMGPHAFALLPEASDQMKEEVATKVTNGQA
jgi:hypothetical protein